MTKDKNKELDRWNRFSRDRQREVCFDVVKRRSRQLLKLPNVLRVVVGTKVVANEDTGVLCVTAVLRRGKKWRNHGPRRGFISPMQTILHGPKSRRVAVAVPTDVVEEPRPMIQSTLGAARCEGIFQGLEATGTACCLVRHSGFERPLVLSAHHVVYLTDQLFDHFDAGAISQVHSRVGQGYTGRPFYYRPIADSGDFGLIGLEQFQGDEAYVQVGQQRVRLIGHARNRRYIPWNATVATPRGALTVRYRGQGEYRIFGYHGGSGSYVFSDIVKWECNDGDWTQPGDSGSPVVDEQSRLIGMHIAGDNQYAYMLPAYEIMNGGAGPLEVM